MPSNLKTKKIIIWALLVCIILLALISLELNTYFENRSSLTTQLASSSNQVTPDRKTYKEDPKNQITYTNSTEDMVVPITPVIGEVVGRQFIVTGKARGTWFFEASFPVKILDAEGNLIFVTPAMTSSNWMTTDFVPFVATMTLTTTYKGSATVVLQKDNPSGIPENDASVSFPITIDY